MQLHSFGAVLCLQQFRRLSSAQPPEGRASLTAPGLRCRRNQRSGPRPREQVHFKGTFPEDPLVAIVGGGLAGLVCAIELARRGVRSVVFDTGQCPPPLVGTAPCLHAAQSRRRGWPSLVVLLHCPGTVSAVCDESATLCGWAPRQARLLPPHAGEHGVGGRLGTRAAADGSLPNTPPGASALVFDHAAQYFTATDSRFLAMVQQWEAAGAVRPWRGPVGMLGPGGGFAPLADSPPRYVATGGMRSLAQYLASTASAELRQQRGGGAAGGGARRLDSESVVHACPAQLALLLLAALAVHTTASPRKALEQAQVLDRGALAGWPSPARPLRPLPQAWWRCGGRSGCPTWYPWRRIPAGSCWGAAGSRACLTRW